MEREDTAKGSGKIWRLKPRQQGWTPGGTPGQLCTGNLGLQSAGRKQQGRWGSALLCAGQRLAEACPGGDGLVGPDPSPEPLRTSGWEGTRAEGCDRDSGRGASDLPSPLQPITAPGPHPSCTLHSNPNYCPCARNQAAITGDETGEGADSWHFLTSNQGESWSKRAMAGRDSAESSGSQLRLPVRLC